MRPADFSTLAAQLATSEAAPVVRHAVLSLAAASDASNVTWMSIGRLAERVGVSRGYLARALRKHAKEMSCYCSIEEVPGRASKWIFRPERWRSEAVSTQSAGALGGADTQGAGAPGGERRRTRGGAPARHVSGTPSSQLPTRAAAAGPDGPPPPAWDSANVLHDGRDLPSPARRRELIAEVLQRLRSNTDG